MTTPESPQVNDSDESVGIYTCFLVLAFFATLSVALRFWARRLMCLSWQIDDYLALIALLIHHGLIPLIVILIELGGLGKDTRLYTMAHPGAAAIFYQCIFVGCVIYAATSPLIKLSVLAFYWRIFPTRTMKIGCIVLASLVIMWGIVIGVVDFFVCKPLHAFWNLELQKSPGTKCVDIVGFWLGNSASNCAIDLATLILPINEVVKLRSSISKKIGICAVFLLGSVALAASLTRTITSIPLHNSETTNVNQQYVIPGLSTVVEVYIAIIGACLPTLVPVYRRLRYGDALRTTKASYPKVQVTSGIKTIGQISYRSDPRPHIPRFEANGTTDCETSKENHFDTICLQEIGEYPNKAWTSDTCSAI
ncbi:hypothetical protein F5Y03DRAFT_386112 [Xylaria venustula]|nr:hypothetical protein F5Y03DRAFT_386112 [Xylaria venustula]